MCAANALCSVFQAVRAWTVDGSLRGERVDPSKPTDAPKTYNFCNAPHVNAAHYELPPNVTVTETSSFTSPSSSDTTRPAPTRPSTCTTGAAQRLRTVPRRLPITYSRARSGPGRATPGSAPPASSSTHPVTGSIDQLDKADAPPIPEVYMYLLSVQCLVSLSDGLACTWSTRPVDAPRNRACPGKTMRAMLNAGWPALLAALSFLFTTNLSDPLFGGVLAALPPCAVAALGELPQAQPIARSPVSLEGLTLGLAGGGAGGAQPQPPGLSPRNLACARALVAAALFLAAYSNDEAINLPLVVALTLTNWDIEHGHGATRLGLEALRQILPGAPSSSVGKQYSKYSAASAGAPLLTTLGCPPLPRPAPLAVVARWVSAGEARQSTFGSASAHCSRNRRGSCPRTAGHASTSMEPRRLGLEVLHQILPGTPSSLVGKQYSKCLAVSAGVPLPTTLGRPPLPRPAPLAVVPRRSGIRKRRATLR
ncbi:hypothetical protein BC826DRAFT_1177396 [Russula brevipes]|nr:hypothetical protein BC826DRAFT_1177396 [Russula brevipes]